MGGIMYYLEHEPDTMAPLLRGLIRRFLASRISNPGPISSRSASYTYLQTLDAMKKPKLQDNKEPEVSVSETYNLESIPGLWATFFFCHIHKAQNIHFVFASFPNLFCTCSLKHPTGWECCIISGSNRHKLADELWFSFHFLGHFVLRDYYVLADVFTHAT